MYEEMLQFTLIPSLNGRGRKLCYRYVFGRDEEDPKTVNNLMSITAWYDPENEELKIDDISKSTSPSYESYGFSHLGTKLFVDMLTDMKYRLELNVKKITGNLAASDKKNGSWNKSIPFYADLPKFINEKLFREASFCLMTIDGNVIWTSDADIPIKVVLPEIIAGYDQLKFMYIFDEK